jgi:hypothetical protein
MTFILDPFFRPLQQYYCSNVKVVCRHTSANTPELCATQQNTEADVRAVSPLDEPSLLVTFASPKSRILA